jgi:hypothetical protein
MSHMCITEEKVAEIVQGQTKRLEDDLRTIRNWAIGLLSTIIIAVFGIGAWVGGIENRVGNVETAQVRFEDRLEDRLVRIEQLLINLQTAVASTHEVRL